MWEKEKGNWCNIEKINLFFRIEDGLKQRWEKEGRVVKKRGKDWWNIEDIHKGKKVSPKGGSLKSGNDELL